MCLLSLKAVAPVTKSVACRLRAPLLAVFFKIKCYFVSVFVSLMCLVHFPAGHVAELIRWYRYSGFNVLTPLLFTFPF